MSQSMDVGPYYGAFLLGGLFAFILSGCVNVQFVVYLQVYSEDPWSTKSLVVATWFLDSLHSAFIVAALWDMAIVHFGSLDYIDVISWSVGPSVAATAMVTFLAQSFFIYRLYRLQREKFTIACPLFIFSFCRLIAACVTTAEMIKLKRYSAFAQTFPGWILTLGLSLSAFVDIVITVFLCYLLRANRSQIPSTNRIIGTLTLWTVQNGSVTSIAATASLICWVAMPQNRIFLGVHFVIAKLHANSLLATLNARTIFRNTWKYNTGNAISPPINVLAGHEPGNGDEARRTCSQPYFISPDGCLPQPLKHHRSIAVTIEQTVESKYDDAPGVGSGCDDDIQRFRQGIGNDMKFM